VAEATKFQTQKNQQNCWFLSWLREPPGFCRANRRPLSGSEMRSGGSHQISDTKKPAKLLVLELVAGAAGVMKSEPTTVVGFCYAHWRNTKRIA